MDTANSVEAKEQVIEKEEEQSVDNAKEEKLESIQHELCALRQEAESKCILIQQANSQIQEDMQERYAN